MKVLIIAPRFKAGRGLPNALYFLKYIGGFKLLFYTLNETSDGIAAEKVLGVKAVPMNNERNHYVMQLLVRYIVERLKPEYIISIAPELMVRLNERMLKKSLVIPQGFYEPIHFRFEPKGITVLTTYPEILYVSKRVGCYAAISKYMYQRIKSFLRPKKLALTYNPVREHFFQLGEKKSHTPKPFKPILLYVGRLCWLKGVHKLIQWFPDVVREFRDAELHIAGNGPLLSYVYHMVHKLNLNKKVFIHGYVKDDELYSLYERSTILVTASYWESFCLPVAEAAAASTPSVVREAYALKEHVKLGYATGFREDSAEAFVEAVGKAIDNYDKLARAAYSISRKLFHPSKVACRILKILETLNE